MDNWGIKARRGVQYCGIDSPDVVTSIPEFHFETKRTENPQFYKAMEQAIRDADGKKIPIVAHRKNRGEWVAMIRFKDLADFASILVDAMSDMGEDEV